MQRELRELSNIEKKQLHDELYSGVLARASQLSFVLGFAHAIYGFSTFDIIHQFNTKLDIVDNVWPRLILNVLPILALGFFLKRTKRKVLGAYVWVVGYGAIFIAACMVHVWPIMYSGKTDIYFYFHAANMFIYSLGLVVVAPPVKVMIAYSLMFVVAFLAPVLYMVSADAIVTSFIINDFITATMGAGVAAYFGFSIRKKLSAMNIAIRGDITPFLGKRITSEIYKGSLVSMSDRVVVGLMMSVDIRGYTGFKKNEDPELTAVYMKDYHSFITKIVGDNGGYIHKSNGDGHLISFGVIEEVPDLSDIPGLEEQIKEAHARKLAKYVDSADKIFKSLVEQLIFLSAKYDIGAPVSIGAAVGAGDIRVIIHGDANYRREIDIDGDVIFRVTRLEAYTKVILGAKSGLESCLIFSPEVENHLPSDRELTIWTVDGNSAVRDFPAIRHVFCRNISHLFAFKKTG